MNTLVDELYESSEVLEDYRVAIRYPGDWFEPTLSSVGWKAINFYFIVYVNA